MELRIFTEPQQGATYDQILAMAKATEAGGFDAFFRSDHYQAFSGDGLPGPTDAWITLAGLARETSTIRLGTLVSPVTFRGPGPLAISVAQVDQMSGGRVELGLGTGWNDAEHASYALAFPPTKERFEHLDEQLTLLHGWWSTPTGERFSWTGQHYSSVDSPGLPKPMQRDPHSGGVPIVMGGYGATKTPRLAARFANEFNLPFGAVDVFRDRVGAVRRACEAIGREPSSIVCSIALTTVCGSTEADVARRATAAGQSPAALREHQLAGTPAEVIDKLGSYAEVGATRAYLQLLDLDDLDHVALLATEVLGRQ